LAADCGKWSLPLHGKFNPGENSHLIHLERDFLDYAEKGKISASAEK
jgi:hypothetical protein